jgi:hypothetical protein
MITLILLTGLLAQSDAPVNKKCTLEGQVVSAATGGPLKHASLRLSPAGHSEPNAPRAVFTSSTDVEGKFVMRNVGAGTYTLSTERVGYITQEFGARSASSAGARLKLDAGQSIKDLVIKLIPQAVIFGKVIDDDGEPVPDANIQCLRWTFINGRKRLTVSGGVQSQADGSFVVGDLTAGPAYLSADVRPNWHGGEIERAAGKSGHDGFLRTYFPNALDSSSASPVEVSAGAYRLTSLAPGDYRIYAWEEIESGLAQEPTFRKNFESRAAVAKLQEKSHESIELKLISKDAIEVEAAKIR